MAHSLIVEYAADVAKKQTEIDTTQPEIGRGRAIVLVTL